MAQKWMWLRVFIPTKQFSFLVIAVTKLFFPQKTSFHLHLLLSDLNGKKCVLRNISSSHVNIKTFLRYIKMFGKIYISISHFFVCNFISYIRILYHTETHLLNTIIQEHTRIPRWPTEIYSMLHHVYAEMNTLKASESEGLPGLILTECAEQTELFTNLFNLSRSHAIGSRCF